MTQPRLITVHVKPDEPCRTALMNADAVLSERFELTDDEIEQHIDDLAWAWRTAYARFEAHGLPTDRDEALMLLHLHNRAILSRSPAAQAARWAEIERSIDEQVAYFASESALQLGRVTA